MRPSAPREGTDRRRKRLGPHVRGRRQQAGRIPLPPVEILELGDGAAAQPTRLRERGGWLRRLLTTREDRFVLDASRVPPELLAGRASFPLLEIETAAGQGRPVLHVLPGMTGELRIGVSCMTVAQMLADPALRDPELGGARLPLAYGVRLEIHCGPRTFVARVGGGELCPPRALQRAAVEPRLASASA